MFPKLTFLNRTVYVCSRKDLGYNWDPWWLQRYKRAGLTVSMGDSAPGIKLGERTVKDKSCWVIPFPGSSFSPSVPC